MIGNQFFPEKKKRPRQLWQWLLAIGLTMGMVFFIFGFFVRGVGFLAHLAACFFFFVAWWGLLLAPWQGRRMRLLAAIFKGVTVGLVLIVAVSFVWIEIMLLSYGKGNPQENAAVVIVLGAGLYGEKPSSVLVSRLDLAYEYLNANPDSVAIVAGGQGPGETITEALAMERYLTGRGIDPERIFQEDKSSDTLQNIGNARDIMIAAGLPLDSVVIVSNSFHLYRAGRLAQDAGLTVTLSGAPVPKIWLTPLNSYVQEYFSIVKMFLRNLMGGL